MRVMEAVKASMALLSPRDRHKLAFAAFIQSFLSLLDLVGVILIGALAALAVTTIEGSSAPDSIQRVVDELQLPNLTPEMLFAAMASLAAFALLSKSLASILLLRRVFRFLASRQAQISAELLRKLGRTDLAFVQSRSSQVTAFALSQGVGAAALGIIGNGVVLVSELSLLAVLAVVLLAFNPLIALASIAFFGLVALGIQAVMGRRASRLGSLTYAADVTTLDLVQEFLNSYREISASGRRPWYVGRIERVRWQAADAIAETQIIMSFPKYLFEVALVIGGLALAAYVSVAMDPAAAAGTVALFVAAATRVMPAILRLQTATLTIRNCSGMVHSTFDLATDLTNQVKTPLLNEAGGMAEFRPFSATAETSPDASVQLVNVTYTYPGAQSPALCGIDVQIHEGQMVALVGASGAGKSTLADLSLGLIDPNDGSAFIGGVPASQVTSKFPGFAAYVPQRIALSTSSVRANVALGIDPEEVDVEWVWECLRRAHLDQVVRDSPEGLSSMIGEHGLRLSGGQRQRLGIARALYSRPRLLVLDEATSALDAETEQAVSQTLRDMAGTVTTIVIAHRLSTVVDADQVLYLDSGKITAKGTFDQVSREVPALSRQARLLGISR